MTTPGSTATPGDSVRPVNTGQEAHLEKTDQCLDQSEFSVLNSPGRSVQLEHNVNEQPGDVPNLQIEHLSEHFQVDQDLVISDSPDIGSDDSTERLRTHLQDSGFQSSGTGHTFNPLHICENKGVDQLHGNRRTDQSLCFCPMDSTISLLPKSIILSLYPSSVIVQLVSDMVRDPTDRFFHIATYIQPRSTYGSISIFIVLILGSLCLLSEAFTENKNNTFEPHHEKPNILVSDLVRHKPGCTATEDG